MTAGLALWMAARASRDFRAVLEHPRAHQVELRDVFCGHCNRPADQMITQRCGGPDSAGEHAWVAALIAPKVGETVRVVAGP